MNRTKCVEIIGYGGNGFVLKFLTKTKPNDLIWLQKNGKMKMNMNIIKNEISNGGAEEENEWNRAYPLIS